MYTESAEQGYVNFRGQRSSQGQMTKVTYFSTKQSLLLITKFSIQLDA